MSGQRPGPWQAFLESLPLLALPPIAVAAIGLPNFGAAADFFSSSSPSYVVGIAAVAFVVWVAITSLVFWQLIVLWGVPRGRDKKVGSQRGRIILLLGLAIFLGGLVHHSADLRSMCCGNLGQAAQLAR